VHWGSPIIRRTERKKNVVLSYGDRLETDTYKLHSSFSKAKNFINGNSLISLVSKEAGNGPVNIVLNKVEDIKCKHLAIADDFVEFCDTRHYFTELDMYNSRISFTRVDIAVLNKNLSIVSEIIKKESPEKSLVFLIDSRREKHFSSSFDKNLVYRLLKGWDAFCEKNYLKGTAMFKGTGYGFTPSGDDFLAGFLTGLYLKSLVGKDTDLNESVDDVRKMVYREGRTGNVICDNYLRFAYEGCFYEKTKNLLLSFLGKDETALKNDTYRMIRYGETSGADFATGIICALKFNRS
jgi:hypothetical protein